MTTRLVGLIGGMSYQSTALYYHLINQHTASHLGGIHSANLLIRSLDYADIARFTTTGDFEGMTSLLVRHGHELKAAGAQAIALCANVAHRAADTLETEVGLPVLHIADFTAREIVQAGHRRVGLLGTRAVMEQDFYKARLKSKYGLDVFVPPEEFRSRVDGLIFDGLSKESADEDVVAEIRQAYQSLVEEHNVECVVLACTEFRLVFPKEGNRVPTFETARLHARGIAEWAFQDMVSKVRSDNL